MLVNKYQKFRNDVSLKRIISLSFRIICKENKSLINKNNEMIFKFMASMKQLKSK